MWWGALLPYYKLELSWLQKFDQDQKTNSQWITQAEQTLISAFQPILTDQGENAHDMEQC